MEYGLYQSAVAQEDVRNRSKFRMSGVAATMLGLVLTVSVPGKAGFDTPVPQARFMVEEPQITSDLAGTKIPEVSMPQPNADVKPVSKKSAEFPRPSPNIKPKRPIQMASLEVKIPKNNYSHIPQPYTKRAPLIVPKHLNKKLFGSAEFRFDDERKIKAWSSVYQRFVQDTKALESCLNNSVNCNDPVVAQWAASLRSLKGQPKHRMLSQVNVKANQVSYVSDKTIYGRSDYWASPREFLQRAGDCEDFALLKFASLLALGFDNQDIRLVVGTLPDGTPHAFLTVKVGTDEFVMDNRQAQVYTSNNRSDYIPKYSVNLTDRWSHFLPRSRTT